MEIWVVNAQENPPFPRDVKGRRMWRSNTLCEVLADRGHSVIRWRASFSHQAKKQLVSQSTLVPTDNYRHQYIMCSPYHRHVGMARVLSHRSLGREFTRLANAHPVRPDVIHVCNVPLELSEACVNFGERHNIPVVVDVRDLWPDSYLNLVPQRLSFLRPVLRGFFDLGVFGSQASYRKADAITAITDPILEWALAKAARSRTSRDVVFPMAYPPMDHRYGADDVLAVRQKLSLPDRPTAIYSGNVGFQTDFDSILAAGTRMLAMGDPMHILIVGSGPRVDEIRQKAATIPNVTVTGWVEGPDLQVLLQSSQVGILAFRELDDYVMSIPNKFTEYMSAGLAVVCGTRGEMWRLVEENRCGIVFEPGNSEQLASALASLAIKPELRSEMSRQALQLHAERFSVDRVLTRMADHLEDVAANERNHQ